jgi:hypothetical protein
MDDNTERTPHPEEPAEGPVGVGVPADGSGESSGQSDSGQQDDAPLGGDENTEDQLQADNAAEEDTLKTLDPDAPPA